MGKYVTKNQKEDEKRVVSVRIRRPIFEAFKGASIAAQEYGTVCRFLVFLRPPWRMQF